MRGEVEIWDGDKLIHKESNLLVNGAGELIADIMTVSPSLSGIADHATSSILDSSNYTIQAISFGKDASAYHYNAHALNSRRNLLRWSTVSSLDLDGINSSSPTYGRVSSCPDVTPPPGFENVPSSVAHVVTYIDLGTNSNVTIQQLITMSATPDVDPPSVGWASLSLSAGQDEWICRSSYIKLQVPDYPMYHPTDRDYQHIHYKMQIQGAGNVFYSAPATSHSGVGRARSSTDPRYAKNSTEFSGLGAAFVGDNRRNTAASDGGYSIDKWDQNGGAAFVGNGWYRVWTTILSPVSATSSIYCITYPAGYVKGPPAGTPSGGIYVFGEQLEVGRWPTSLQINNNFSATNWDFSGSVLNRDHSPGAVEDNGTVRVVPRYLGTSSYIPTNYLSSPPNPDSTRLEDRDTDLFGLSSTTSGFNIGQNLNVIPYRDQKDQLPVFFDCFFNYMDEGGQQRVFWEVGTDPDDGGAGGGPQDASALSGMGSIGPQAYYLGCYPEGSSTGGSNFALVSSLDNSAAYPINYAPSSSPYFVSGTYNSIVNEASSMDVSGFVGKVYDVKQVVGNVPNPNKLSYTGVNGVADGAALPTNKAWTSSNDALVLASVSAVEITNPLGGASSTIMSGTGAGGTYARTGFYSYYDYTPSAIYNTSSRITISVYVKRPDSNYTSSMELGINRAAGYYAGYMGIEWNSTPGVPTFKYLRPTENVSGLGYSIEDAGNDWYRLILSISGLPGNDGDDNKPIAGEAADIQVRIGDADGDADGLNINEKTAYIYGPQMEEHPVVYNLSATSYHEVAEGTPTIAEQNGTGGLHVSGGIDATNSGTVEYSITVGSGDVGYSNLYGGIYNMGLWTIDMNETLKAGNTPPYSFGPLNNPRKYRLFATKHLTKNLGYIEDRGTDPGALNYSDLTIKWRLHFL